MSRARWMLILLAAAACGGGGGPTYPATTGTPPTGTTTGGSAGASASVAVRASNDSYGYATYSFDPADATITRGGTVSWSNGTGVIHNITFSAANGAPANVGDFSSGTQTRTFDTAGTYAYHCTHHSGMEGTITVQ